MNNNSVENKTRKLTGLAFSCSTQLSMKIKLLINTEIAKTNGTFMLKSPKPVTHPADNCSKLLAIDHL